MKITLPTLRTSHAITNEEATRLSQSALEQKDKEDYAGAQETMRRLWAGVGQRPILEGLHPSVAAEVLLTTGILTGWIGSKHHIKDAQESAKDLLSESLTYFESVSDVMKTAAARTEIAFWLLATRPVGRSADHGARSVGEIDDRREYQGASAFETRSY